MPQHEEHCLHSEKRYGVRGDEIHTWIDEPSQISGGSHRNYRHDLNSLPTAIQIFGKICGAEMVENIFLDHLKADSEENRKREQQLQDNSLDNPNLWTQEDDNFLWLNFMKKSDEELESELKVKSKSAILKRRKYLGLIRPKVINRTRHNLKVQRLVFKLERCQKFFLTIEINGGKNDIDFGMTGSKNKTIIRDGYGYRGLERVFDGKTLEFVPEVSDNYSFYFSNAFSVITKKDVLVSYHLENGKEVKLHFGL